MGIRVKKDLYERARRAMVDTQLVARGIRDKKVLDAMLTVPRHLFVEEGLSSQAYTDYPLPIGEKQTISQPYMVAFMTEALGLTGSEKVLEVGSGSGYQSAVLSLLCEKVYAVERLSVLAERALRILDGLHCSNVVVRVGDGTRGWPEEAPFDAILVAASSPTIPHVYVEQLREGGRLVMPVGDEGTQRLVRVTRRAGSVSTEVLGYCRFVKLIGRWGWEDAKKDPAGDSFEHPSLTRSTPGAGAGK